jgi:hypothetical protein
MRALRVETALVGSALLSACILGEAQKIEGGSGAGGGAASTATVVSASSGLGGDGLGGAGGMPPTCTSQSPGSVEWVAQFGEDSATGGGGPVADQRVTQLAVVPDGVLALGQYSELMTANGRVFPPAANAGNAFLAWFSPSGAFASDGVDDKIFVFSGEPALPRGLAARMDSVAVAGAFQSSLTIDGVLVPGTVDDRDAFVLRYDGEQAVGEAFLGELLDPPPRDHFDDVVVTSDGTVIVSGYTDDGLDLPGGSVGPNTTFIASLGTAPWVVPFDTGYAAQDAIQLALGDGDRLFIATSIKDGPRLLLGETIDVISLSGVLVAELSVGDPPALADWKLFEGDQAMGDQAFLRDLVVGPNGDLAVVGTFFGDLIFDFGSAQLVSAGAAGQTDGFVAVLDSKDLSATHWQAFGGDAGQETVWSAGFDVCGDVTILGTFAGEMPVPDGTIVPMGVRPLYAMKLAREAGGMLVPEWTAVFDYPTHEPCAAAGDLIDRICYRLVATETGIYAAGAFANQVGFSDGTVLEAQNGEDAFLVKLTP